MIALSPSPSDTNFMQFLELVECLRLTAKFINSPEGSQKGQDSFLMEKAAEVIERTFRVLERHSSEDKPGAELLSQICREVNASTDILPPDDFVTPPIPGYKKRFELNRCQAVVGNAQKGSKADACVDAS